jgi:hypothetical protein
LHGHGPYGNKTYHQTDAEVVKQVQHLSVLTPVKNKKDSAMMESQDQCLSTAFSLVRQLIEALFLWTKEKTGIECASKFRTLSPVTCVIEWQFLADFCLSRSYIDFRFYVCFWTNARFLMPW